MALPTEPLYDFTVVRGDTLRISLIWRDEDDDPVDLTGYGAVLEVRSEDGGSQLLALSSVDGRVVLGDEAGTIVATIAAEETQAFVTGDQPPGGPQPRLHYQVRVTDGVGRKTTVLKGRLILAYSAIEG